jgi:hypothetical protein
MPKFMLTIFGDESAQAQAPSEQVEQMAKEYFAFSDEVGASGALIAGEGLQPTQTARTVRGSFEGEPTVTDGPFAETKEQLGGFYVLECKDIDEAEQWARKIPGVRFGGSVEVRPVQEFPQQG